MSVENMIQMEDVASSSTTVTILEAKWIRSLRRAVGAEADEDLK